MPEQDALRRLIAAAQVADPSVGRLEGRDGLVATIETSDTGAARMVRVHRNGAPIHWGFSIRPGEAKPPFYPGDLPWLPTNFCNVWWSPESGTGVMWVGEDADSPQSPGDDAMHALGGMVSAPEMQAFVARLQEMIGEGKKSEAARHIAEMLPAGVRDRAKRLWEEYLAPKMTDAAAAIVDEVTRYHQANGWEVVPAEAEFPAARRWHLRQDGRERELTASGVMGASMVTLGEK